MSVLGWCQWLEQTPLAIAISESVWLFPIIEGSHILALPLSVGMMLMFDLRLLGLAFQGGSAARLMHDVVRWSKVGFAVMFITGALLFMTHASQAYENAFFLTKLALLLVLGVNAAVFQIAFYPKMAQWEAGSGTPRGARVCGGLSLVLWLGVIICGRTMAYQL